MEEVSLDLQKPPTTRLHTSTRQTDGFFNLHQDPVWLDGLDVEKYTRTRYPPAQKHDFFLSPYIRKASLCIWYKTTM